MSSSSTICAFTSVCEEDRVWIPQYLKEIERLNLDFCIHLDRCSRETEKLLESHPLCRAVTEQRNPDIEFDETHKQRIFDALISLQRYEWAMPWDIDETWEEPFWEKVKGLDVETMACVDVPWLNLWNSDNIVRIDGPFGNGHRIKFYNLTKDLQWAWKSRVVNGPKAKVHVEQSYLPVICIHHGMKTRKLREEHKERWDRIYTTANRGDPNPYGFWDYSLNEKDYPPILMPIKERMAVYAP